MLIDRVAEAEAGVQVWVRARATPSCPACLSSRVSYHSAYDRKLMDLPWQGRQVHLRLRTRRFRCRNTNCGRKIFAERLEGVAAPRARETCRLGEIVGVVGYVMGGLPGSRLLKRLGVARGPDTILRRVKARQSTLRPDSVRVLGVDDWAWRKQQNYGTLLMDLEQSKVIDLLPDRSAESFARWLQGHPEVAIITRDRSGLYADGARKSAPFAAQITDRYHLVSNLAEAVERDVQQLQTQARAALAEHRNASDRGTTGKKLTLVQARYQRSRQARYEKYMAVVELRRQGLTQVQIGGRVGLDPGDRRPVAGGEVLSGAARSQRPETGSGAVPGSPAAGCAPLRGPDTRFVGTRGRVAHPTTAETLSAASRISWDVLAVLSGGTSVAPVGAPVPGDAALAECR